MRSSRDARVGIAAGADVGVLVTCSSRSHSESLARVLAAYDGIGRVRHAGSYVEALRALKLERADVMLLDETLAGAVQLVQELRSTRSRARVIMLACGARENDLLTWADAGVAGYVSAEESLDELVAAILDADRPFVCSAAILDRALARASALFAAIDDRPSDALDRLTGRERHVLQLISEGRSNKFIAERLGISLPTVKNHVHGILGKLRVRRRGEAAAVYLGCVGARCPSPEPLRRRGSRAALPLRLERATAARASARQVRDQQVDQLAHVQLGAALDDPVGHVG